MKIRFQTLETSHSVLIRWKVSAIAEVGVLNAGHLKRTMKEDH